MENYDFNYKKKLTAPIVLWLVLTLSVAFYDLFYKNFEEFSILNVMNLIYIFVSIIVLVPSIGWLVYVNLNTSSN